MQLPKHLIWNRYQREAGSLEMTALGTSQASFADTGVFPKDNSVGNFSN
jgi:hypothetical protein